MTVVEHEIGHALGLGDVSNPNYATDVMYGTYNGIKTCLTTDDVFGIQAVDGVRQFDVYNTGGKRNLTYFTASNITSSIGPNAQIAIPGLDMTTPGDSEWFTFTVPSNTTGNMTVTAQSSNLSSFSPKLMVYNSSLGLVGSSSAPNSMGATVSVSASVAAGQSYYVKVLAAGGYGPIGSYGLLVNMGSQTLAPISPPNTVVAGQPDQGGGTANSAGSVPGPIDPTTQPTGPPPAFTTVGSLQAWAFVYNNSATQESPPTSQPVIPPTSITTTQIPIAPLVTIPTAGPSPLADLTTTPVKHHSKAKPHPTTPRFAIHARSLHVKNHAKIKHIGQA
jgi:hypothetical protein